MMDAFRPPAPLKFSIGNVKEKWRKWRQELENYLLATEKDERTDKIKIAILLNLLGSEGLEIFNTFKFEPPESQKNYSEVLQKFEEYCSPRQNVVYERYKFFSCVQKEGQAIECYVTQLKTLASTCEFEEQENGLIRDRIVLGIRDSGLKELLLRESGLGLEKAVEIVRAAETSREQIRSMKEETVATVNSVKRNRRQNQPKQPSQEYECKKCGRKHKPRECPAYGKMCTKCNKKNHFAVKCFQNSKNIHEMKVPENELDIYIDSVTEKVQENELNSDSMNKNVEIVSETWYKSVTLNANDKYFEVDFKLHTGAVVNSLPLYVLNIVKVKPKPSETNLCLTAYGTGEFPDEPYHITLKDNVIPVIHPPKRVPQALQTKLKETLDKLEKEKIVSKVNKPTDWVQNLVIVEKPNGNLRLCLDPRDLNKVIKREHYQIPSADDIISRLESKKIFSVVDLKDGFWHVPLDEVSSEICTFNAPFGRYKFNKMPFGIASAPEIFQKRNQKLFGDIEGVEIYFDDIIVAGNDEASHDAIMSKVLEGARSVNIKFNPDKLQYRVSEVKYVGQIISKSGKKPDLDHIKAIVEMPTPKSKIEVRRLLGMINFLSKFIPNINKKRHTTKNLSFGSADPVTAPHLSSGQDYVRLIGLEWQEIVSSVPHLQREPGRSSADPVRISVYTGRPRVPGNRHFRPASAEWCAVARPLLK
ncbi:Transposon Ty3-G Gag-Pol polyprotein [Araneus ventricosus]|uniref:Transposon Ty3-G Gag-Pol polyprotein n=1 Tax=Araneus ventricosus TaxID=182803 RepID=A0A4Y2NFI2_ARAVE|nr:Transposon Ty3-G Gag-Pol polyprotein [Araneus ventricosus]